MRRELTKRQEKLTSRQNEVLDFLVEFISEHGFAPSYREVCNGVRSDSTNAMLGFFNALERKGWIVREPGRQRAVRLTTKTRRKYGVVTGSKRIRHMNKELSQLVDEFPDNVDLSDCETPQDGAEVMIHRVDEILCESVMGDIDQEE
jgi:SOS-response transcriptional repressor LexA